MRTAVLSAEQQIEQVIAGLRMQEPTRATMTEASHKTVHNLIVSLITIFRDHVADSASATQIARVYATCVAGAVKLPDVNCILRVLEVVRTARRQHLPA